MPRRQPPAPGDAGVSPTAHRQRLDLTARRPARIAGAAVCALVVSLAVFVTFFLSTNYLAAFIQLPGPTALSALSDRFLFISASIAVSALAALMVWDALALEPRDVAILGPLPISARTIIRAKLAAVLVFGAVLAVALNAIPSVLYPAFLTINMRGMSGGGLLRLIAAHATTWSWPASSASSEFWRREEYCFWSSGNRGFRRVSTAVQSALVVFSVSALLLAPTVRATGLRDWVAGVSPPRWPAIPCSGTWASTKRLPATSSPTRPSSFLAA